MCGICGIVTFGDAAGLPDAVATMTDTLRHRGPDDHGVFTAGPVALGHTRLSIIDLSSAGHQPMRTDDGAVTIVYNGEVYNFPELRLRLEREGERFRGRSDTEVVLRAFARWGSASFAMLHGMFAIALWDASTRTLHLVRDRFGIKPLYYARSPEGLVFGSEIKAILASGRVGREMCWPALHEHLYYGNCLGQHTMFAGIERLLPGHRLRLDEAGCRIDAYWSVEDVSPVHDGAQDAANTIRERLDAAVGRHLLSDVPVGVFLSGGIDFSAITGLASEQYDGKLKTYSVGFDFDRGTSELPKARFVAERFGTEHHELHIAGANVPDVIEKLVRCHDEPFSDAANIPLYLLCERLQGAVKVILQGDGGDEIFAGYRRYNVMSAEPFWRRAAKAALLFRSLVPRSPSYHRAMRFLSAMSHRDPAMRVALLLTMETLDRPPLRVLTEDARAMVERFDPFAGYREVGKRLSALDRVQRLLYTDTTILLPDTYLEKVDKSTMAHGIEIRVPMLDADLTAYAMGLPSSLKVRRGQKKWILRRALRGKVPDSILDGRKLGFGVPVNDWMRHALADYLRSVLLDASTLQWGLFDRTRLEACITEHTSGQRNAGFMLYKLLNLALWHRFYLN